MKIQNINNYFKYEGNKKPLKNNEPVKNNKFDTIEIKHRNKIDENKLDNIKEELVSDINKETSTEKINRIKESIKDNSYKIDIDEIAKKLLDK